jgi:rhamnosyl/mannosyltransferase
MRQGRVLHLGKYYPPAPGGVESHVQTLARGQADAGWDVDVLCVNHADTQGRDVTWRRYGATTTLCETDGRVRITRLGRSAHVARFDVCPHLPGILAELRRTSYDIIHLHTPNPLMVMAAAMLLRSGTPIVITHHSDIVRQRWLRYALEPFQKLVYGRASRIIVSSEGYLRGSEELEPFRGKSSVVPFGIGLSPYLDPTSDALRYAARLRDQHGSPLWLAVGRCVYYKGFSLAVRALQQVPGRLMIVGKGPEERSLRDLADRLGVADRLVWASDLSTDELAGAYHAATALWFTSHLRSEAFGLVQVEAMAAGCPVINSSIHGSGVAWVSPNAVSGLTIGVGDLAGLVNAANQLTTSPDLRDRLSRGARERAATEFCRNLMVQRTLAIYSGAIESQQACPIAHRQRKLQAWVERNAARTLQPS